MGVVGSAALLDSTLILVKIREYRAECRVPRPRAEVFAFFANPSNLAVLTPPWVRVDIPQGGPASGHAGMEFGYRVWLHGLPMPWRGRFEIWEAPHRFVDIQLRGPYRRWRHEHAFEETDGGTRVLDHVQYAVWGGGLIDRWIVRPELVRMFEYRSRRLAELFPLAKEGAAGVRSNSRDA
jgi:ligand-binding SRPBCC domain-containing protein